ncbi:NAD(P)/FAD-dependent oxidoreductase [Candidatus Bathyarchaeota archaeon]|nr:NAD(P)/FAD-dependent oxidoreductase [Candidatus Bathyarchaeota archaeon]
MEKYDVVVVGAGTAGTFAAKTVADAGLNICMVESKEREKIGEKVCGDALGDHHFKELGIELPRGGELEKRVEGVKIFSPNEETVYTIADSEFVGYMLNRRLFGQWLLKKAEDAGAVLHDSTMFLDTIVKNGFVTGIVARDPEGKTIELESKVVVDASGYMGVVRRKLPEEMGVEKEIEKGDVGVIHREIRQLQHESENTRFCEIYLNHEKSPSGYTWIFPGLNAKVNTGLGVRMVEGFTDPRKLYEEHVLSRPMFKGSELIHRGTWFDPTRRPLDKMVGNGVMITGDAAWLVNPLHGGGIGPSMLSGQLAGRTIVKAFEKDDVSETGLWPYGKKFMGTYGRKQASIDIFRILLQASSDTDMNYGMECQLLTEDDVLKAGLGDDFRLNITETARRVFRGLKRMRFLNKLRLTANMMRQVKAHYDTYPNTPEGFESWHLNTLNIWDEARNKLEA